jgi:predicted esterase
MSELNFIHRFVPGKNNSSRTLLLLHGTGGDENDLIDLGHEIDPDAALMSPRGKILENGRPRFFRRLAEGVFDEEDVVLRANELARFVEEAANHYKIDIERLVAVGYSNGANIAAAMMLLGISKFRLAILLRAMVPLSKLDVPDLKGTQVLISAGQLDPIARLPIAERLGSLFENAGTDVTFRVVAAGHELTACDVEAAKTWLESL